MAWRFSSSGRGPAGRVAIVTIALAAACGAAPTSPGAQPQPVALAEHASAHFTFHYPAIDASTIAETAVRVEREYARVIADLGVTSMPRVHVTFYLDHAALEAATRPVAGVVPAWTYGLVTAEDHIHVMSPNLAAWAPYAHRIGDIVHEFAHCVSLRANPRIANNPRWLWEAVAIFESRQFVDPRTLPYMTAHQPPPLAALNSMADTRIYDVGYTVAEFIISRWGQEGLRSLVASNGDVGALGPDSAIFFDQWFAWTSAKYGF